MTDYFEDRKAGTGDLFRQAHQTSDTDEEPTSHHHTLGTNPTQAAAGNHHHDNRYDARYDAKYAPKTIIDRTRGTDLPNVPQTTQWTETTVTGPVVRFRGAVTITSAFGGLAYLTLPYAFAPGTTAGAFSIIGYSMWVRQTVAYMPAHVWIENIAASRAAFMSIQPVGHFVAGNAPYTWQSGDSLGWDVTYNRAM